MTETTKVKWLVENFEQDNKIWKLIEELKRRGQELEFVDYYNYAFRDSILDAEGNPTKSRFGDNDCVVFQGSIQLALWIKRNKPWVPAIWLDPEKFKCTTYYSYLGEHLFNQKYEFTTLGEFLRKYRTYYKDYGIDNCVFVRPDTGLKSFTGQVFYLENHRNDWQFFGQLAKPTDVIVVAQPRVIRAEYRVVIANGEPIAASMYQHGGQKQQLPGAPKQVMEKARVVAAIVDKEIDVGPMYVVDIAVDADEVPWLMEINCFNCAGLYECDKAVIVDAANQNAAKEWREYHEVKA